MKEKMKGKVQWFNEEKGYGFIVGNDDGKSYFFHYSSIIMEGNKILFGEDQVEFLIEENEKGMAAKEIGRLIEKL